MSNENFISKIRGFFGGSPTPEAQSRMPEDDDSEARHDLHYYFAHRFLPEIAARDARGLIEDLSHELAGTEFLGKLWLMCARGFESGQYSSIPSDGLKSIPVRLDAGHYGVVVQLPKPKRIAEAHFVAVVVDENKYEGEAHLFYTLELGHNMDGSQRTVLGQWSDGSHYNFGDGPAPQVDPFVKSINSLLSSRT